MRSRSAHVEITACPIDLRLLHAFLVVAREGHVGRAARQLAIEQSPLSRQIMRLEETLGVRLFERQRDGVRMTSAGHVLFREAPKLLRQTEIIAKRTRAAAHQPAIEGHET